MNTTTNRFIAAQCDQSCEVIALESVVRQSLDAACAKQDAEIARLKDDFIFVERWANHHGTKPHMTAQNALSCIQHYPPIRAITKGYADGKVPVTYNPYAEIARLREALLDLADDIADRFDLASPSTNPGMKSTVLAARAALATTTPKG